MPTPEFYEVSETLLGTLLVLGFWAVLMGLWIIVTLATFWAIVLTPFAELAILCVYLLQSVLSLALNHFPRFVILVLTAYIVATRDRVPAKQEPRQNIIPDPTPAKQDTQRRRSRPPTPVQAEPQHQTLDEFVVEFQRGEWSSFVEDTRQANP